MVTTNIDASFIESRTAKLVAAYNALDVETALTFFADDGLDYSDYGVMALHMAKPAFADFLRSMFGTLLNLDLKTVSISGHKDFQAWEWEMSFVKKEGGSDWDDLDKGASGEDGTMKMKGVSLSWWDEKGEKIVRECDYARFV